MPFKQSGRESHRREKDRIAIVGLGTVGREIARRLCADDESLGGYELTAVVSGRAGKAVSYLEQIGSTAQYATLDTVAELADVVIECAPAAVFEEVARVTIEAGKLLIPLSVCSLLPNWDLVDRARDTGATIHVPTGAFLGLDAVQALAQGDVEYVRMITRKPVGGLIGAPYVQSMGIRLDGITEPVQIFSGTVRDAARGFPENLNVAVALALAGIGPDRTVIEVWADPELTVNTHRVVAKGHAASLETMIRNVPTDSNAATGLMTALSVVALLRKLDAPLRIGT